MDSGELELIFSNSNQKSVRESFISKSDHQEVGRRCPICKKKMEKVEFENSRIILDRCTNNHGLWFDNGELKSLLKTSIDSNNKMIDLLKEMFWE